MTTSRSCSPSPDGVAGGSEETFMAIPDGLGIIDTCMSFPVEHRPDLYASLAPQLKDQESRGFQHVAEYMFKDRPVDLRPGEDPVDVVLAEMDKYEIAVG